MIFKKVKIKDFRNIEYSEIVPGEKVNIICGENAQGKTNLVEAMWLFTGAKSFRQSKDSEFIRIGCEKTVLNADFYSEQRDQNAEISFNPSKQIIKNGIEIKSSSDYAGTCGGVVFSPAQMNLFRDGPKERRKLADTSLCQLFPRYITLLNDYKRVMEQRNTVMKDAHFNSSVLEILDVYDQQLSNLGGNIIKTRVSYCKKLNEKASNIYEGMSSCREEFFSEYESTFFDEKEHVDPLMTAQQWAEIMMEKLYENRKYDIEHGVTSVGPHRDDIKVLLDGLPVKSFGSQGQQRSCILSLKLGEAKLLGEAMGEPPLILLDDVMSELDGTRREYLLNSIGESQIFVTCCDRQLFQGLSEGKVFTMESGKISECE